MNIALDSSTLHLERDGLIAVRDGRGTLVSCVSGTLWITQDHDTHDNLVGAGETLVIDYAGLTLLTALEPTDLRLIEPGEDSGLEAASTAGSLTVQAHDAVCGLLSLFS